LTDLELVKELVSETCRCSSPRKQHQTFCQACYFRLSPAAQKALYARLGKGYREAYEAAVEFLDAQRNLN
jgi:hypothetical protein